MAERRERRLRVADREREREIPEGDGNICVSQATSVDTDLCVASHVAPSNASASAAFGVETRCARGVTVQDCTCHVERCWSAASDVVVVELHTIGLSCYRILDCRLDTSF
jgi:hypothetical protein